MVAIHMFPFAAVQMAAPQNRCLSSALHSPDVHGIVPSLVCITFSIYHQLQTAAELTSTCQTVKERRA
eukprot:15420505-Alexandrium_andersonii.AAC.1